jgi:hypothetical protein
MINIECVVSTFPTILQRFHGLQHKNGQTVLQNNYLSKCQRKHTDKNSRNIGNYVANLRTI